MKLITSRDNPLYRELRQLASSSAARRKLGRTVLDGVHLCQAYLEHIGLPLACIVSETSQHNPEVSNIIRQCKGSGTQCILLEDTLYHPLSQVENGVDITFIIFRPINTTHPELKETAVLLDRIQDPGNLGSILRSAAAAGITQVFCSAGTAVVWSPRVLRAGMGAHFLLQLFENVALDELIKSSRISVIATTPDAQKTIYDTDLRQGVAWLFGHEGQGVSETLLDLVKTHLTIPQVGSIESLNVAASAAVCFFEQVRQQSTSAKK